MSRLENRTLTLRDVSEASGVSEMTVSRVLRGRGDVSQSTREKVLHAAKALGYVPNKIAGALASQRVNLVAVIIPSLSNMVFPEVLTGINSILENKPINIFEKSSKNVYRSYLHIDELIYPLIKIVKYSNNSCPIFNVGSDKPISIWKLSKFISNNYRLQFIYPKQNNNKFDYYVPNLTKLKKILNFKQKFDLKKSISYTLKSIKN